MRFRTTISVILFLLIFISEELWQLWKNQDYQFNGWWFGTNYPLHIQWYVKEMGERFANVFIAALLLLWVNQNHVLKMCSRAFIIYRIVDLVIFFGCDNKSSYKIVYSALFCASIIFIVFANFEKENKEWDDKMNAIKKFQYQ